MNILTIKGGGVRGVIVTRFLIEIEKITNLPISTLFDYIGGSSVGCLISMGMLMSNEDKKPKYTAQELHDILLNNMDETFTWSYGSWIKSGFGLFGSSYVNSGLLNVINKISGDEKMSNLLKPVIFPAYDKISHKVYYFEKDKDANLLIKDVAMSCTAAPTYFPSYKITINDKQYDMVDGGIVVNNTAELAFLSATKNMSCIDKTKILELNIGTGVFENNIADSHGLLTWLPVIVNTLMHACNENGLYELSLSLPQENYYILDVPLNTKYYTVDDYKCVNYLIDETEKWIKNNHIEIKNFCIKLMKNKGYNCDDIYFQMCESFVDDLDINTNFNKLCSIKINDEITMTDNELDNDKYYDVLTNDNCNFLCDNILCNKTD